MAWRAGAELTLMETTGPLVLGLASGIPGTAEPAMQLRNVRWLMLLAKTAHSHRAGGTVA